LGNEATMIDANEVRGDHCRASANNEVSIVEPSDRPAGEVRRSVSRLFGHGATVLAVAFDWFHPNW
jgi:hypothetical protein